MNDESIKVKPTKNEKGIKIFVLLFTIVLIALGIVLTINILMK